MSADATNNRGVAASFLIVSALIFALAAAAQAVTGFGFALLAVPLLAVATDARTAVVGTAVVGLVPLAVTVARDRRHVRWRTVTAILLAAVAGLPLGLLILRGVSERVLTGVIAVVVLGCAYLVWRPPPVRRPVPAVIGLVGVLTGVLTTATGTNGPPLVASFQTLGYGPRVLRATLAAIFFGTAVLGTAGFAIAGAMTSRAVLLALIGVPSALAGWYAGNRIFTLLDARNFRRVLLGALAAAAVVAVLRLASA